MNGRVSLTQRLQEILKSNTSCADCGAKDVTHASYNIGVVLCSTCAAIHKELGSHISSVKHLTLDHWEESQVERLRQVGNAIAKTTFEQKVPNWMVRPKSNQILLLQHWIYAKYVDLEFSSPTGIPSYLTGSMDGFLMKKMREDGRYFPRRFILENFLLSYFVESKTPKASIKVEDLTVSLSPPKIGRDATLQLDHLTNGSTRHIYLYHDQVAIVCQWYLSILASKAGKGELNEPIECEGWLWKAGPSPSYAHRKRWFTLAGRKLMYHVDVLDAYPKGEVFLGPNPDYRISMGGFGDDKMDSGSSRWTFTVNTPSRTFILSAETRSERDRWVEKIGVVMSREMTSKDVQLCEKLVKKRSAKKISILK